MFFFFAWNQATGRIVHGKLNEVRDSAGLFRLYYKHYTRFSHTEICSLASVSFLTGQDFACSSQSGMKVRL